MRSCSVKELASMMAGPKFLSVHLTTKFLLFFNTFKAVICRGVRFWNFCFLHLVMSVQCSSFSMVLNSVSFSFNGVCFS